MELRLGRHGSAEGGNETTEYFVEWLRKSGLQPDTIVGVHGPIQTRAELEAALGERGEQGG